MRLFVALLLFIALAMGGGAFAQTDKAAPKTLIKKNVTNKEEGKEEEKDDGAEEEEKGESEEKGDSKPAPPKPLTGDIITFKSGKKLSSVQVLRETVLGVDVQVLKDLPPLRLSKDQIASIEYDAIDPNKPETAAPAGPGAMTGVAPAEELSPEINRKITTPLAPEDLKLAEKPLLDTLAALAKKIEVPLEIAEPVKQVDPAKLIWKTNPPEGATLFSLLQEHMLKSFPELWVLYKFDKITLTTRSAAPPTTPPAPGAPPAVPPAPGAVPAPGAPPATPPGVPAAPPAPPAPAAT